MVAQSLVLGARRLPRSSVPTARLVVRRIGRGLGSSFRRRHCFRPMVSRRLGDVYQCQGALGHRKSSEFLCSSSPGLLCRSVRGQLHRNSLSPESRGHSVSAVECHRAADFALGGVSSGDLSSSVYHGSPQHSCGLSVSRPNQVLGSEWTLKTEVFQDLRKRWPVTIDLFATSLNHQCSIYFSPFHDPNALATDALLQNWNGWQAYAFPPWSLILAVLKKLRSSSGVLLTIIAPYWPQRPWFPDLLDLVVDGLVALPLSRDLLRQPHFHRHHQGVSGLALYAWRLSSDSPRLGASPSM